MTIIAGKTVSISYTLTLNNGEMIDSNIETEPLTFTQGSNEIIPGLENALLGRKVGDTFQVSVQPENGYGVVSDEAFIEVPKEHLPPEAREIGAQLTAVGPEGQELYGVVIEMVEEMAKLDFNHPLAGEVLHFDVTILGVE
ncbi:MAG: FKBP-type peptidyl-prolyl cis-trans isomerase [Desulfobulbaceae bacterium]|jgi:FKBP-type peptidyl-prolyl cis-trans isomerase 2|nr:FKBP-type peptidyl-prolyl cis-trans isomerase [Desulfobulbaceae bacterium]